MKTIREAIAEGTAVLRDSVLPSDTPFLDALVLLSHTLKISKEKLLASYPDAIAGKDLDRYMGLVAKRSENYPVSYITGRKEFYGLPFFVDNNVLIPRPDSETLVESALKILEKSHENKSVLDLCTGSGALGISLKHTLPHLNVTCTDISPEALSVCRKNSRAILGYELEIIESNLFDKIDGDFDIIITNPPYLTGRETSEMMETGWPEPPISLDGGTDGLDFIRTIINEAHGFLKEKGSLIIESGIDQTDRIADMLISGHYRNVEIVRDLTGRKRVTMGQRGPG